MPQQTEKHSTHTFAGLCYLNSAWFTNSTGPLAFRKGYPTKKTLLSNAMSESYLKHLLTTFSINLFNHLCFIQLFTPFCPGGGFRTLSITFSQENYVIIFTQIFVPLIAQYFNLLRNDEVLFV